MTLPAGMFEEKKAEVCAALEPITRLPSYRGLEFAPGATYVGELPKLNVIVKVKALEDKGPVSVEVSRLLGKLDVLHDVWVDET